MKYMVTQREQRYRVLSEGVQSIVALPEERFEFVSENAGLEFKDWMSKEADQLFFIVSVKWPSEIIKVTQIIFVNQSGPKTKKSSPLDK